VNLPRAWDSLAGNWWGAPPYAAVAMNCLEKPKTFYVESHRILTELSTGTLTLTHYDYRIENLFFSSDESEVAVIDWQLLSSVKPSWDFAYLVGTNIDTDLRRTRQQEYIELYLKGLLERGIDYSEAQLREDMKWTLLGLSVIPVIGGSNFDAENERSFELFKTIAVRHFETVADFDALSVIA